MQDILRLLAKFSFIFLFIFLEALSFYLIVQNNDKQRNIFITSSNLFSGKMYEKVGKLKRLFEMDDLMDSLMKENIELRESLVQNKYYYKSDPQIFHDTLSLQHYQYTHAKVVDKTLNLRNNIFTINKGIEDRISKGMGVIEKNGVVGVVGKVGRYFSSVIPLMNVRSSISVVIEKNGALGSLVWNGDNPKRMLLEGIPKHIQFELRDRIITSGYSLFPRGIVVGEIVSFKVEPGSNFYSIEVQLKNDPSTAYNVLVVKNILLDPADLMVPADSDGE